MARSAPFFSVVIPAYNAERWIGETLESFANQTDSDFEVVLVDDGSSDGTVALAEIYSARMDLSIVREPRSGAPARPCNVGTGHARGRMIVCCDADDLAVPDRLASIRQAWDAAEQRDCLIFSDHSEIDEAGLLVTQSKLSEHPTLHQAPYESLREDVALLSAEAAFDALVAGCFIRPCSVAIPRRVIERLGGYDEQLRNGQDYDLYLRAGWQYPFLWIKHTLGLYRRSPGNISSRPATQMVPSRVAVLQRLLELPLSRQQERVVRYFIAQNYQSLGYEYGDGGELAASLRAYLAACRYRLDLSSIRGMAISAVKSILPGNRRAKKEQA